MFKTNKKLYFAVLLSAFGNMALSQQVGSKVSFLAMDGKTHTGIIKSIWFKHFKIKDDVYQSESWFNQNEFTLLNDTVNIKTPETTNHTTVSTKPANENQDVGTKVSSTGTNIKTDSVSVKNTERANVLGSKVSVLGTDSKIYTGTIIDSSIENYKVKYDGFDDEAWADKSVFNFINTATKTATSRPEQKNLKKGAKVEFDLYGDGSKWVRGTVIEVIERNAAGCVIYKVNYDSNHMYNFHRDCKQVRMLNTTVTTIKHSFNDSLHQPFRISPVDTLLIGNYNCFQAIWDYNTKTSSWEARGLVSLNLNGTFHLQNNNISGHFEWDSFKNEIRFHDGLEGAIGLPKIRRNNTELNILIQTEPAIRWSCSIHRD